MNLEEVVAGVHMIDFRLVNCFVLDGDELALIDAGMPRRRDRFDDAWRELGRSPGDLKHVALTHYHEDHMGTAAELVAGSGATLYAHPVDAPVIRGDVDRPALPEEAAKMLEPFRDLLRDPEPSEVRREVVEGDVLPIAGGLRVIHTPGHTAGHVAYLLEAKKVLFVGDAVANESGLVPPPFSDGSDDDVRQSIKKLAELEFDVVCFGHGPVLRDGAASSFRKLVDRLATNDE